MRRLGARLAIVAATSGLAAPAWADGAAIVVRELALPVEARSARAALARLYEDERLRAHALTRSRLTLRLELMPEARATAASADPNPGWERCPTLSQRERTASECRPRACRLSDFEVGMEIDVLIPEWQPLRTPDADELTLWEGVQTRLRQHEQRHREHAEVAAQHLHARLAERLGRVEDVDCLHLQTQLENLRETEVQNLRLRDRVFDETSAEAMKLRRRTR
ncbi:DUF922 domain-containing protein [Aquimonas voraii]|uniref:DUF922 domain-containing protein n=1 Tax=Aquimonas voraii TaxID=265719 RepID=A0A1G7A1Q4_9GAMM|nr:DUF922 domain-containing protein [Aquimonas voraii]SDE07985.1 protein of unknown function [Aquimonas voraii]